MAYIITNISNNLPIKHPLYDKDVTVDIVDNYGQKNLTTITTTKPLIIQGSYLPKQFHFLQVKGLITITPISETQCSFYISEQKKIDKPITKEVEQIPIEKVSPKVTSKVVSKKG